MSSYDHQDWNVVIIRSKEARTREQQQQRQQHLQDTNKHIKSHNNKVTNTSVNVCKLENETEDFHVKRVPMDLAKLIERTRTTKKLSQESLGKALNISKHIINDIEKGKAIYNGQQLATIKRYLGI